MNHFDYLFPESLEAAVHALRRRENAAPLAGGTDLIPLLKAGVRIPVCLLSLAGVQELKDLNLRGEGLFIGSMVTLAELIENPLVQERIPVLAESALRVASPQIRNQATVGGNILQGKRCLYLNQSSSWRENVRPCFQLEGEVCHQIPGSQVCRALYYSDLAPVLLAFDAAAEILDEGGSKTIPLEKLIHNHVTGGNGRFILKGISVPSLPPGTWGKFLKASTRSAIDFSLATVALRYSPAGSGGEIPRIRIVIGAMSPEPFSLEETARELSRSGKASPREKIFDLALREGGAKMALVRETAVSAATKKQALEIVKRAVQELLAVRPS